MRTNPRARSASGFVHEFTVSSVLSYLKLLFFLSRLRGMSVEIMCDKCGFVHVRFTIKGGASHHDLIHWYGHTAWYSKHTSIRFFCIEDTFWNNPYDGNHNCSFHSFCSRVETPMVSDNELADKCRGTVHWDLYQVKYRLYSSFYLVAPNYDTKYGVQLICGV